MGGLILWASANLWASAHVLSAVMLLDEFAISFRNQEIRMCCNRICFNFFSHISRAGQRVSFNIFFNHQAIHRLIKSLAAFFSHLSSVCFFPLLFVKESCVALSIEFTFCNSCYRPYARLRRALATVNALLRPPF